MAGGAEETKNNNENPVVSTADEGGGTAEPKETDNNRNSKFKISLFDEAKAHDFSRATEALTPLTIYGTSFSCIEDIHDLIPVLKEAGINIYNPLSSAPDDKPFPAICEPIFAIASKKVNNGSTWTLSSIWATAIPTNLNQPHQMMNLRCKPTDHFPDGQTFTICHNPSLLIGSHPMFRPTQSSEKIHPLTRIGFIQGLPPSFRPNRDRAELYKSLETCLANNESILDPRVFDFTSLASTSTTIATNYINIRLDPSTEVIVAKTLMICTNNQQKPWVYKGHNLSIKPTKSGKCPRPTNLDDTILKAHADGKKELIIRLSEIANHLDASSLTTKLRKVLECEGLSVLHFHKNQYGHPDNNGYSAIIKFNNHTDCYYANRTLEGLSTDLSLFMPANRKCKIPRVDLPSTSTFSLHRLICRHFGIGSITRTEVYSPILTALLNKVRSTNTSPPASLPQRGQPTKRNTSNQISYASVAASTPPNTAYTDRINKLENLVINLQSRLATVEDFNSRITQVEVSIQRLCESFSKSFQLLTKHLDISLESQLPADTASAADIEAINADEKEEDRQEDMQLSPNRSGGRKRSDRSPPSSDRHHKRGTSDGTPTTATGGSLPSSSTRVEEEQPPGDPPESHD